MGLIIGTLLVTAAVGFPAFGAPPGGPTRTIVDSLGRRIVLPQARLERILSLQPEITRLIVALGAGDKLVGIDHFLRRIDPLFKIIYPAEGRLPLVSMADYSVNLELVIRIAPEVIFGPPEDKQIVEALQKKTSIPTVALSSEGRFSKLLDELKLVGEILGRADRAKELADYFESVLQPIKERTRALPSSAKPRVYLSFWGVPTRTPVYYEPVNAAGGINVAENLLPSFLGTLIAGVGIERILVWNPDIILVHGNYPPAQRKVTTSLFRQDTRLAPVKAVRTGRVRYTFGFWNWWDPAEVLVETSYLAHLFHPGLFPEFDLEREGEAIFKAVYGVEGAFRQLSGTLGCGTWLNER